MCEFDLWKVTTNLWGILPININTSFSVIQSILERSRRSGKRIFLVGGGDSIARINDNVEWLTTLVRLNCRLILTLTCSQRNLNPFILYQILFQKFGIRKVCFQLVSKTFTIEQHNRKAVWERNPVVSPSRLTLVSPSDSFVSAQIKIYLSFC